MDEEKMLLLAVDLLDSVPYHETQSSVTWETCTLRQWMNGTDMTPGGNATEDKVFSLSNGKLLNILDIDLSLQEGSGMP